MIRAGFELGRANTRDRRWVGTLIMKGLGSLQLHRGGTFTARLKTGAKPFPIVVATLGAPGFSPLYIPLSRLRS